MGMNVYDTLSHAVRQWPEHPAIIDAAGSLDFKSLWREIEALRGQLEQLGVGHAQGVGVRGRNGRAFVIGALAALGSGAVVMPIHHLIRPAELSEMLARAPLSAILDDGSAAPPPGEMTRQLKLLDRTSISFTRLAA